MLILDEPTNHLDIDSRDALVDALNEYSGAVLIISHDRHLIESTVDKLWIAQNGTVEEFDEDLDSYQRMLTSGKDKPVKTAPQMATRRSTAKRRGRTARRAAPKSRRCANRSRTPSRSSPGLQHRAREGRGHPRQSQDL